jgi:hypothetical protein
MNNTPSPPPSPSKPLVKVAAGSAATVAACDQIVLASAGTVSGHAWWVFWAMIRV